MPHFSMSKWQPKQTLNSDKEYRIFAYLNFSTPWNDGLKRYEFQTEEQKEICNNLFSELSKAGVKLSVTITERSGDDVKSFPVVARMPLFVNKYDNQTASNAANEIVYNAVENKPSVKTDDDDWGF
tara:strand:+ start:1521 stop:1898 length:378 start_codon:yes stop_codon:yes gene_type:complete